MAQKAWLWVSALLLVCLLSGCKRIGDIGVDQVPDKGAPQAEAAEGTLARHGITPREVQRAVRWDYGIGVVRVTRLRFSRVAFGPERWVDCLFTPVHVYRAGHYPEKSLGPILPEGSFVHLPDHRDTPRKELLEPGKCYLLIIRPNVAKKIAYLQHCVEVKGVDDPLVKQLEAWLPRPAPAQKP